MEESTYDEVTATINEQCTSDEQSSKISGINDVVEKLEEDLKKSATRIDDNRQSWKRTDVTIRKVEEDLKDLKRIIEWLKNIRERYLSMMRQAKTMCPVIANYLLEEDSRDVIFHTVTTRNHVAATIDRLIWTREKLTACASSLRKDNTKRDDDYARLCERHTAIEDSLEDALIRRIQLLENKIQPENLGHLQR